MTSEELKKVCKAVNLSQRALSEITFYSLDTVRAWMSGKRPVPTDMRIYLMRAEIDVDAILADRPFNMWKAGNSK